MTAGAADVDDWHMPADASVPIAYMHLYTSPRVSGNDRCNLGKLLNQHFAKMLKNCHPLKVNSVVYHEIWRQSFLYRSLWAI